jgi:aminocarboxymuconate-semialdehyde decarboxylase
MLIDCHAHVLPDAAVRRFPDAASPRYVTAESRVLGRMLEEHDRVGVSHAVVSDSFYLEHAREALPDWPAVDRARLFNDGIAELVGRHPGRLFGLGCVDPFGGAPAAHELERLTGELGLVGVLINPWDGVTEYLDAPRAEPFLATAAALGVPVFVHPTRDLPAPADSAEFGLHLSLARPHQTATCVARLIYSGALDRHPALRLLLAHGGGTLPYLAGRLDATWQAYRPDRWQGPDVLSRLPSSYLGRLACDTNTWSAPALRLALEVFGPHHVLFGNDYPPVWVPLDRPLAALEALDMPAEHLEAIRWRNAVRFFGLPL